MSVSTNEFDIYAGDAGYVAVTNEVRRTILSALSRKERDLADLMRLTGKAKPTLSNLHVRALIEQGLVEEVPHPTDARRKVYRLRGHRIGSSNIPIDELRGAVKQYATLGPQAAALTLPQLLDVLLAGGDASAAVVEKQARRLGEISAPALRAADPRELLQRVAAHWEREGITRTARIDLEDLALELDVNERYAPDAPRLQLAATLLGGFLWGLLSAHPGPHAVRGGALGGSRVRIEVAA